MRGLIIIAPLLVLAHRPFQPPDPNGIVQRSVAKDEADWRAEPAYDHCERDDDGGSVKTYDVVMIDGTPYERLVAIDNRPLSESDRVHEQRKLQHARTSRGAESPSARAARIGAWQKKRGRLHAMFRQLPRAFTFALRGDSAIDGRDAYQLDAEPNPAYAPPSRDARALTGMTATFWIDAQSYHWRKLIARIVKPVSIVGLLVRVEPGTVIELEKAPVDASVWLPTHLQIRSESRIFLLVHHHTYSDQQYFNYRPSSAQITSECRGQ